MHQSYLDQGFDALVILIEDDDHSAARQAVIDHCCYYREEYGLHDMVVAADPGGEVTTEYMRSGTPLNMVLDQDMVIRWREEGYSPDNIQTTIENILAEE